MDNKVIEIDETLPFYEVRQFLANATPGKSFDAEFARLIRLPVGPRYSANLNAVVSEISTRPYWWHLSHIQAVVIPTAPASGGAPVSNSQLYDREGSPIKYTSMITEAGHAMALCRSWLKSAFDLPAAYYVHPSAIEEALAKEPTSEKQMMRYYRAREKLRQGAIQRFNTSQYTRVHRP